MIPLLQQFTAVALPVMLALGIAAWLQKRHFADIIARLGRIEVKLGSIEVKLEEG